MPIVPYEYAEVSSHQDESNFKKLQLLAIGRLSFFFFKKEKQYNIEILVKRWSLFLWLLNKAT